MDDDTRRRERFRRTLRAQHGVFTAEQARAAGVGVAELRRRVRHGEWARIGHRLYRVVDHAETPRGRVFEAVLGLGPDATVVGLAAAWCWQLVDTLPARIEVAVAESRRPEPRRGVRIVRRAVPLRDRQVLDRIPVAKKPLAVLQAAVALGPVEGAKLTDRALVRGAVSLEELRAAHWRSSGRWGATAAARLLALAAGGACFEAERVLHRVLRSAGITGWEANVRVTAPGLGHPKADLVFRGEKVIVEVDGWAYHRGLRAFLLDGPRRSALAADGWIVLSTHWHELTTAPDAFLERLRRALASRAVATAAPGGQPR